MPGKNLHGMNTIFRSILEAEDVQSAHAVLVTGDVTDVGDRASWRYFKRTVSRLVPEQQIIVVAGNHDVCRMDWSLSFGEFFSGLKQTRQHKSLERLADNLDLIEQRSDYPWPLVLNDPHRRVMVIALDSNHSGHFSALDNAVGRLGSHQLDELERILVKHGDPGKTSHYVPVKIVAVHHSPNIPRYETLVRKGILPKKNLAKRLLSKFDGMMVRWTHQIPADERRRLRELCLKHKVRLVTHGHMHRYLDRRVSGLRIIGAPASTQPILEGGKRTVQFCKYTIRGDGGRLEPELVTIEI